MTTKIQMLREIDDYGRGASFLANVVTNGCRRPARKLRGLLNLLLAGHAVQCAQFDTMTFTVDGAGRHDLSALEDHV